METVGVVVGPWSVGGVRAAGSSVVWAAKGGLVTTPLKNFRSIHAKEDKPIVENPQGNGPHDERKSPASTFSGSYFETFPPLATLNVLEVSPCGKTVIVGGHTLSGTGLVIWKKWPLQSDSPAHTLMSGHTVLHLEFSSKGDYLGVLSVPEVRKMDLEDDEDENEMVLTLWQWPVEEGSREDDACDVADEDSYERDDVETITHPQQLLVTSLPQLKPDLVSRMSLARGLPDGVVAAMIAAEEELSVWQVIDGPLGRRVQSSTIGFGLLHPDRVFSMYCLATDAYALGVGGGWVVIGVESEVRVWLGGGGCRPCHQGPVTDLLLHSSHLYTIGGDGWLRVWESETLEEAAVKAAASGTNTRGWCETGVTKAWLQLLREVSVHKGPGVPVTLLPFIGQQTAWIIQTNTGVIYSVWEGEWLNKVLHQGPSGRVSGVAMAPNHPLLATTTEHRYLQVTSLPQDPAEHTDTVGDGRRRIPVPSSIAQAEIPGSPRCVTWAICQLAEDDNLLAVGLEDGSVTLFLLHTAPKISSTRLTLVQTERPHESPVVQITASKKYEPESSGRMSVVVTASEDCRVFIFRLVKAGKITKLEPVGFHQLDAVPERVEVKEAILVVELKDGIMIEIPIPPPRIKAAAESSDLSPIDDGSDSSCNREAPNSWLLQHHPSSHEHWEGSTVVRQQLLEEVAQAYCPEEPRRIDLTIPSLDGKTMLGVTSLGRVVHLHESQGSYSVRLSRRSSLTLQRSLGSPRRSSKALRRTPDTQVDDRKTSTPDLRLDTLSPTSYARVHPSFTPDISPDEDYSAKEDFDHQKKVIGCINENGTWVSAWVEGTDLFLYKASGASFSSSSTSDLQLRQVGLRGVVIAETGPSLEQRAQKEAGERQKFAMEERASLLQQKLSKLKWDFRKLALRGDQLEGGQQLLEDLPLHQVITSTLNSQTTQNMNKVVGGSSYELERLEVLLGKLKTLYSWNPIVSTINVKAFESDTELTEVDTSEEVYALLSQLAQVRQNVDEEEGGAAATVSEVRNLLGYWLESIRSGQGSKTRKGKDGRDTNTPEGAQGNQRVTPKTQVGEAGREFGSGDQQGSGEVQPGSPDGDMGEEEPEKDSLASLQAQVREVVGRVGSAGRGAGGEGGLSEADLDVGRELKWRRTALNRLKEYREREESRNEQLVSYKVENNLPLKDEDEDGNGEGITTEEDHDQVIQDEVKVPPLSVTVEEIESLLWSLLGKVEAECNKSRTKVEEAAQCQLNVLQEVNSARAEWGHRALNLTHQQQHLTVKVTDELVNEFYCDLLDLDEPLETSARPGIGGDITLRGSMPTSRRTKSSPRTPAGEGDKRPRHQSIKRDSEGTDVPPLSLSGSPRMPAKSTKTPRTGTTSRSLTTSRSTRTGRTGATTSRTPKTLRSGKGRKSQRESPKPPPAPRPPMSLEQVQAIQRRRTGYLTDLGQVPEAIQDAAKEADVTLNDLSRQVIEERGCLAWAVQRAGQLVKTVGVRVRYRDGEKKLRMALRERIKERKVIKDKVLALRERIQEYDREVECLVELEEEVERAFSHLVTDNAQFEVQLTRYFESRAVPGLARRQSVSSSSDGGESEEGDEEGADSGDNDSGLGTDEARMDDNGPRPPGCDPAVFSLVTQLRDLRWRVAGAVERSRRERLGEERRHTAVLRRLVRATHLTHSALSSLTNLQAEREKELGAIPTVVWLRRSQTSGNVQNATALPYPNIQPDSLSAVRWPQEGKSTLATLLTKDHLQQLEQRLAQAKKAQEMAIRKHRESKAERRALTQQVNQLREELSTLQQTYQVTRACKLGIGAEANLEEVKGKLETGLDLRWPGKVASQMTRHENNVAQLQCDVAGRTRELRALQKEEAALAAHILALRQEKDHLMYHLAQTTSFRSAIKGKTSKPGARNVGQVEELERLRTTVAQQDTTISALRHEISALRSKTGSVAIPGVPPLPPSKVRPTSSLPHTPTTTHRSDLTFGGASSTRPTTGTNSTEVYDEEEAETTFYYNDDEEEDYEDDEEDEEEDGGDGESSDESNKNPNI